MADVQQTYKFKFEFNRKDIKKQLKDISLDVKEAIVQMSDASDKVAIFKDLVSYLSNVDRAISAFKSKHKDDFENLFGTPDVDITKLLESIFGATQQAAQGFSTLKDKVAEASSSKANLTKLRDIAQEVNDLYMSVGKTPPIDIDAMFTGKGSKAAGTDFAGRIKLLDSALDEFGATYSGIQDRLKGGFGFGGAGAGSGISEEIQKKIDKLQQEKRELQETLDAVEGKPIKIATTKENDLATLKKLLQNYEDIKKEINSREFENLSLDERNKKTAEAIRLATLLANTADDIASGKGHSGKAFDLATFGSSLDTIDNAKEFLKKFHEESQMKAEQIKKLYSDMVTNINSEITKLQTPAGPGGTGGPGGFGGAVSEYDKLNKKLKEYYDLQKQLEAVDPKSDEGISISDRQRAIADEIYEFKELTEKQEDDFYSIFDNIDEGAIKLEDALERLCDVLKIDIPSAIGGSGSGGGPLGKMVSEAEYIEGIAIQLEKLFKNINTMSGTIEYKVLINGQEVDILQGGHKEISEQTRVESYLDTLGKKRYVSAHNHPGGASSKYDVYDLKATISDVYNGIAAMGMNIGENDITTLDLAKVKMEDALSVLKQIEKMNVDSISSDKINEMFKAINPEYGNVAKTWQPTQFKDLAKYVYEVGESANLSIDPFEQFKNILKSVTDGKIDLSKYQELFDGFKIEDAKSIFNQIMSLEGKGLRVDNVKTSSLTEFIDVVQHQQAELVKLRNEADVTYSDIHNMVKSYMNEISGDGNLESGDSSKFIKQYFGRNEQGLISNWLVELENGESSILQVTNRIAGYFQKIDPSEYLVDSMPTIETVQEKLKNFLNLSNEINSQGYYDLDDVNIGKYIERLNTAKKELDELGTQGLITATELSSVEEAFDTATVHLSSYTKNYTDYGGGYSYTYEEEFAAATNENERLQHDLDLTERQYQDVKEENERLRQEVAQINAEEGQKNGSTVDIAEESGRLDLLLEKVNEVKAAVDLKTQAFKEEADTVDSVVQQEIQTLERLRAKLEEVKNLVDEFTAALNGQWTDKIDGLFPKLQQLAQDFTEINEAINSLNANLHVDAAIADTETGERQFTVKMDTSDMENTLTNSTDRIQSVARDVVSEISSLKYSVQDLTDMMIEQNRSRAISERDQETNQKVENMKKNILQLFDTINKHNLQDDLDDEITSQEMAAEFFADGSISLGKGESNTVPWNKIAENLLSNLNSKSVMSMHSHPWNVFYDRDNNDIMRLASDNFSRTDGDLGAFQVIQEYGASIASMLAGNILHALDLDKISWHYNDFLDNFKDVEKEYAENPNYSKYFFKDDDDISFRMQDTLSENHEQSNMIKNMLIDALGRTGFSDEEVLGSIYKEYNLTNDDDVTNLSTRLVELSSLSQKAESQVEMLRKILASFDVDVGSDDVDAALKSFEKGEMTAADVWNRFNGSKRAVSQAAIDAVQRIDSGRQEPVEVQILSKIASVLDSINLIVANIEANTQQTINDKLNIGADTLGNIISNESFSSIAKKTNLGMDFANITEYQTKDLFEAAELSMRTLTSDMEAIFGKSTVTAIDAKTLLDSYMRAATDNIAANRAISLYQGQYNTLPVKSDFTDEALEKTIRDNQKSLMNDVAQNILDYINRVRENFTDGVIKTVDIPEKSVTYDYIIDLLEQKSLEAVTGPDKEKRDRITGILTGIAGMHNNSSDDLIEGGEFVDAMTGQIRAIDEIFEDVNTFEKDYGEDLQVVKKYINQVFSKYNAQMDAFLDGDKDFSFFNETSDSKDNSVKPTILSGDANLDAIVSNIADTIDANTQNLNELTNAINTAIGKLDGLGELNPDSIATAVKEAIYAKDIQTGYTKINSFEDAFDKAYGGLYLGDGDYTQDEYMNKFTGEFYSSLEEATKEFEQNLKNSFFAKDGTQWFNNIDDLLAHIIDTQNMEPSYQNDWATVIVQAINAQGDRIAEAIKIVLPNSVSDKIESGNSVNEQEIVDAFQHVAREVSTWTQMTREEPRDFFRDLLHSRTTGMTITDPKTIQAFKTLGMMSESGKPTFKLASQGMRNSGVVIGEEYVMPTRPKSLDQVDQLGPLLDEASKLGAAVPRIVSSFTDSSKIFELQTRMIGENIASSSSSWDFLKATDTQIDKLIHTFETLSKVGLYPDFIGDNVLFDKNKGFSLVDLETTNISWGRDLDDAEGMTKWFLDYVENIVPRDLADQFRQRVNERMALPPEMRSTSPHDISKNDTAIYQLLSKIAGTIDAINSNIQSIASNYNVQQNDANYVKDQYPTQSYKDIKKHNLKYEANNVLDKLSGDKIWADAIEGNKDKADFLDYIRGAIKGTTEPYFTRGRYGEVTNQFTGELQSFEDIFEIIEKFEREYGENLQVVKDYLNKVFAQYTVQTDAVLNQQSGAYGDIQPGDAYVSADMSGIEIADVQEEISAIEKLLLVLQQVEEAVQNKTQAFVNEGDVVGQVVNEEVLALTNLSELLISIRDIIAQIGAMEINIPTDSLEAVASQLNNIIKLGENPHYITDPYGNKVTLYRGINDSYGGLVSNRYHGGTFFTDDIELASRYAGPTGKVESAMLDMKNPLEIDGKNRDWNQIEYLGNGADEASQKIRELRKELDEWNRYAKNVRRLDITDILREEDFDKFKEDINNMLSDPLYQSESEQGRLLNYIMDSTLARHNYLSISNDDSNMYGTHDTNKFVELAKSNGYDGVIFKNVYDGLSRTSNLFVTLQQEQVHYIETFNARVAEEISNLKVSSGDFEKYIHMNDNDIESMVASLRNMRNDFMSRQALQMESSVYDSTKFEHIDPNPAFRALYEAYFKEQDVLPSFLLSDEFDDMDWFVDLSNFVTNTRELANKILSDSNSSINGEDSSLTHPDNNNEVPGKSDYALEITLQQTNTILGDILTAIGNNETLGNLVEPLKSAVTELKNVAHGIVEHQKAQRTDLTDSSARISSNYGQLSSIAGNATAGLGEEYQIENMKALADNVVRVRGAVKDTEGVWKGFVVDIDESNNAVVRSVEEQSAFAKSLNESAKAAKNAADETKKAGDETKEAGPADEFTQSLSAAKSTFNEYRKSLQDVDYLSDEAKDSLDELAIRMGSISNAGELDAWSDDLRALQKQIAISKSGFEHSNLGTIKGVQSKLDSGYNKLTLEQQKEVEEEYHRITDILEEYKASVKDGKKVELDAIHSVTQALREKIEAQLASNQAAEDAKKETKKNEKFGSTVAINATAKYNALKDQATSGEFAGSQAVNDAFKKVEAAYNRLIAKRNELAGADDATIKAQEADFKRLRDEYNETIKSLNKLINDSKKLNAQFVNPEPWILGSDFDDTDAGRKAALTDFVQQVYGVSVASEDFKDNWNKVVFTVDNGDGTFTEMTATLNAARTQIGALAGDVKKHVGAFESFFNELKIKFKSLSAYLISSFSIHEVWQQVRKGVEYVRQIDGALTELKKVTDETDASYDRFLQDMSKTASVVGSTVSELTTMAADWARLGYTMEEAGKLAESTAILLNVSEFEDATKASEALISTMQAFQYTADESQHVVDILNEVGELLPVDNYNG